MYGYFDLDLNCDGITMPRICVTISISADEYLANYAGTAKNVITRSIDGQVVQFPAILLRQFVLKDGIHGHFLLEYDDNNKFTRIEKL